MAPGRAGTFVQQPQGYKAFIPAPFPPDDLDIGGRVGEALSEATYAIGRLAGAGRYVPNPDLFISIYVRREAVLSSQIEGIEGTLDDLFQFELNPEGLEKLRDLKEIVNYTYALQNARARLGELPLSIRLVRGIHSDLLTGARGQDRLPGEIRRSQNWIGGTMPSNAIFVPPPVHEMKQALGQWEKFLHATDWDPLVQAGLMHVQFETLHPFLDGNGRLGRLLIPLILQERGLLDADRPLLYPSVYFKVHRSDYYDNLMCVRTDGDWERWLTFFLEGIREVALEAELTIRDVLTMKEEHQAVVRNQGRLAPNLARALDALLSFPVATAESMRAAIGVSTPTANAVIDRLVGLGMVEETSGRRRGRVYSYAPYLNQFSETAFQRRIAAPAPTSVEAPAP